MPSRRTPSPPRARPPAPRRRAASTAGREVTIRVNGADTEWHADDLAAACAAGPDAIVVPKVDSAAAVQRLVDALERHGAPDHTTLWAMVETPYAMLHAEEIAGASERLTVLVMGTNDLAKELYAEHVPGRQPLLAGLGLALLAARAAGKVILDGVYNDVKDTDGFLAECRQGRELGFDGKTLIHPSQVEGANDAFAPERAGGRGRPRHPRGLGGRRRVRRGDLPGPDDREPARRLGPPDADHPRQHRRHRSVGPRGPGTRRFLVRDAGKGPRVTVHRPVRLVAASLVLGLTAALLAAATPAPALAGHGHGHAHHGHKGKVVWDSTNYYSGSAAVAAHGRVPGGKTKVKLQVKLPGGWHTFAHQELEEGQVRHLRHPGLVRQPQGSRLHRRGGTASTAATRPTCS